MHRAVPAVAVSSADSCSAPMKEEVGQARDVAVAVDSRTRTPRSAKARVAAAESLEKVAPEPIAAAERPATRRSNWEKVLGEPAACLVTATAAVTPWLLARARPVAAADHAAAIEQRSADGSQAFALFFRERARVLERLEAAADAAAMSHSTRGFTSREQSGNARQSKLAHPQLHFMLLQGAAIDAQLWC
jgi:hypothetical protein